MGGQAGQLVQDVAGEEHRDLVLPIELQNKLPHLNNALGVQAVDRLIQHQEIRLSTEGHGNPQPLTHAQGKVSGLLSPRLPQAHQFQQRGNPLLRGQPQQAGLEAEIVLCGQVQIDRRGFHHSPHPAADPVNRRVCIPDAIEGVAPRRGGLKAADEADQCGLPGPVFSHKAIDRPLGDMHRHIVQSLALSVGFT